METPEETPDMDLGGESQVSDAFEGVPPAEEFPAEQQDLPPDVVEATEDEIPGGEGAMLGENEFLEDPEAEKEEVEDEDESVATTGGEEELPPEPGATEEPPAEAEEEQQKTEEPPTEEPPAEEPPAEEPEAAEEGGEQAEEQEAGAEPEKPKRKGGRKKGSKNKGASATRRYVTLRQSKDGNWEEPELLAGKSRIVATNGNSAMRAAYKALQPTGEGSETLVCVPEHYWNPKSAKGRKREDYAIDIG